MSMDHQLFELLQSRFDSLDGKVDSLISTVDEHCKADEVYWRQIDKNEAQIGLIKWFVGTVGGSGLIAWLYQFFGKH